MRLFTFNLKFFMVIVVLCVATVYAEKMPDLPDLDALQPYYAQDIRRNLQFLETRPDNNELIMRIAVLLEAADQDDHSKEWKKFLLSRGLSEEAIDKLESQARERYNLNLEVNSSQEPYNWLSGPDKPALIAEAENKMDLAAREYLKRHQETKDPDYLDKAAERYLWAKKSKLALTPLLQLKRIRPSDLDLTLQIARIYSWNSEFALAERYFAQAQRLRYSNRVAVEHIEAASATADRQNANLLFEQYLKRHPQDHEIKKKFAQFLLAGNERERAYAVLQSIPLIRLNSPFLLVLAEEHQARGNLPEAIELAKKSLSAAGAKSYADAFQAGYFLANIYETMQDYEKSSEFAMDCLAQLNKNRMKFDQATLRSNRLSLLNLLARIRRITLGDAEAYDLYHEILQIDAGDLTALVFLGEYWKTRGNFSQALTYFSKAREINPGEQFVLWSLADLYLKTNDPWKARGILEQLNNSPEYNDQTMLLQSWEETGAWQKLADYYSQNLDELLPTDRDKILQALEQAGQKNKAALIMVSELKKQPFDTDLEQRLYAVTSYAPQIVDTYKEQREKLIRDYYDRQISSLTIDIAQDPGNNLLKAQRGDFFSYRGDLKSALADYLAIIKKEPATMIYLSRAADLAEWSANNQDGIKIRQQIHKIEPENATNTFRLTALYFSENSFKEARKNLELLDEKVKSADIEIFKIAFPVYSRSGEYDRARQVIEKASLNKSSLNEADRKLLQESSNTLSQDLGPVIRTDFNFFHDTSGIKRSTSSLYGRFAVKDHQFAELTLADLALNRNNSTQRGFRGQEMNLALHRVDLDRRLTISLPAILNSNHSSSRLYLPGISYANMRGNAETGIGFSRLPVKDSPEAILQNLYSDRFELWHDIELKNNAMVRVSGSHSRNSLGYQTIGAGLDLQKILSFEPYRAVRYSFAVEDGDQEDSDLFYLENYNQMHQVSWLGEQDFKVSRNRVLTLFWEVFAGLSYRNEPVYGFNTSASTVLGNGYYLRAYGGIYSSENNRFDTTDGYNAWQSGLSIEKRYW